MFIVNSFSLAVQAVYGYYKVSNTDGEGRSSLRFFLFNLVFATVTTYIQFAFMVTVWFIVMV
jgi:hypothetical protein